MNKTRLSVGAILLALLLSGVVNGQENTGGKEKLVVLDPSLQNEPVRVAFLSEPPVIDGRLDPGLAVLPVMKFVYLYKSDSSQPVIDVTYRIAYGMHFLYLVIEMSTDKIVCRDRGWQNGDGFTLELNTQGSDVKGPVEFYQLAFNPTGDSNAPYHKGIWNHNGEWFTGFLGSETEFVVQTGVGKTVFELLLPWKEIPPFHPLLSSRISLNLYFAKAVEETDTNIHILGLDQNMQPSPAASRLMAFDKPVLKTGAQTYVLLNRNNITGNGEVGFRVATLSARASAEQVVLSWISGEGETVKRSMRRFDVSEGVTITQFSENGEDLIPDGYRIAWSSRTNHSSGGMPLTVLPDFDLLGIGRRLAALGKKVSPASVTTMKHELQRIGEAMKKLLPGAVSSRIRVAMVAYLDRLGHMEAGQDVISEKRGYVRRAFLSGIDQTLQPYTVKIPLQYDQQKKYPVIVFLHGSDSDDTDVIKFKNLGTEDFVIVAPNGRGPRTAYCIDHAQEDIEEAIADAAKNYSLDTEKMILAGFSMGGYGVYRTIYETPGKYVAAAVFSGDPNDAASYDGINGQPDFLEDRYLERFKGLNMAVFHGRQDRNCPFEKTDALVQKLKKAGADVHYYVDETIGHDMPNDPGILAVYHQWLKKTINNLVK